MERTEGWLKGDGNTPLYYQAWEPQEGKRGSIFIFHGYGEHGGRYKNVVEKLVPAGFDVYVHDHRGHGKSQGLRTHVDSFTQYIEDGYSFYQEIVAPQAEEKPVFLLGHSMGSIIALNYLQKYGEMLRGAVLSGIGAYSPSSKSILASVARILSIIAPRGRVKFPLSAKFISTDPAVVKAYDEDPLVEKDLTFRLGHHLTLFLQKGLAGAGKITLPVLVQVGTEDQSFSQPQLLLDGLGSEDKTLISYPGLRHEVYNEVVQEREKVLNHLLSWLEERM